MSKRLRGQSQMVTVNYVGTKIRKLPGVRSDVVTSRAERV